MIEKHALRWKRGLNIVSSTLQALDVVSLNVLSWPRHSRAKQCKLARPVPAELPGEVLPHASKLPTAGGIALVPLPTSYLGLASMRST